MVRFRPRARTTDRSVKIKIYYTERIAVLRKPIVEAITLMVAATRLLLVAVLALFAAVDPAGWS